MDSTYFSLLSTVVDSVMAGERSLVTLYYSYRFGVCISPIPFLGESDDQKRFNLPRMQSIKGATVSGTPWLPEMTNG